MVASARGEEVHLLDALFALVRNNASSLFALACCAGLFGLAQPPQLPPQERASLAKKFAFERYQLPSPSAAASTVAVRNVHPSLKPLASWISATGASVALADIDGDGISNDLVSIDPRTNEVTILPAPSTPTRYAAFALKPKNLKHDESTTAPMGVVTGDFNEDGLIDVLVTYWGRTPVVFLQRPASDSGKLDTNSFLEQELLPGGLIWNTSTALVSDFDGDGHLDILVCNYFPDGAPILDAHGKGIVTLQDSIAHAFNGGQKHIFRWISATKGNAPSVTYAEQKGVFAHDIDCGWTIAAGATDLDGDMLPELYLANDTGPDRLLYNRSVPGKFQFSLAEGKPAPTTPTSFVLGKDSFKGMGCDFGDMNNDGIPDIYVSNIACPFGLEEAHFLWLSDMPARAALSSGIAPYRQASEELGMSRSGWGWDCRLEDFNNDGVLEAVQAMGFLQGKINRWPELQAVGTTNSTLLNNPRNWPACFGPSADVSGTETNCFFARSSSGKYFDIADRLGINDAQLGRGIAIGDIDADGRPDFVVANQWHPSVLFHNARSSGGSFLSFRLLVPVNADTAFTVTKGAVPSKAAGSPAIGAQVVAHLADGTIRAGFVDGGSGHSGKRSPEVHIGLGKISSASPIAVDIRWRSRTGQVQQQALSLKPGWYTIILGDKADG